MIIDTTYKLIKKNESVFYLKEEFYNINEIGNDLERYCVKYNILKARVCLHKKDEDKIQKMIIFNSHKFQAPIHCHKSKGETLIILKGSCIHQEYKTEDIEDKIENPRITTDILLKPFDTVNIKSNKWHNLKIISDIVFLELSLGPFTTNSTTFSK